jgi:hypothetical protein
MSVASTLVPRDARPAASGVVRRVAIAVARAVGALLVLIGIVAAGFGWLYLLRNVRHLSAGPRLHEALPLQRLAGGATQPLLRVAAAWIPTGLAGGLALWAIGFRKRLPRLAILFAGSALLLLLLGASADAVTASEALRQHVAVQPHRVVTWLVALLIALAGAVPGRLRILGGGGP